MRRAAGTAAALLLLLAAAWGAEDRESGEVMRLKDWKLTILYDNYSADEGLEAEWGFACLVEGGEETILFDTGGPDDLLLRNMEKMGIDPKVVNRIVLSHYHRDHIGGIPGFLARNPEVTVHVPRSFPASFLSAVEEAGAKTVIVDGPAEITASARTTGVLRGGIPEQALLVTTDRGVIILTGCSHPGIVRIVERAREVAGEEFLLVAGGLHLLRHGDGDVRKIAKELGEMGILFAAPSHCTGDRAREILAEAFGDRFVELGVGRVLRPSDLPIE